MFLIVPLMPAGIQKVPVSTYSRAYAVYDIVLAVTIDWYGAYCCEYGAYIISSSILLYHKHVISYIQVLWCVFYVPHLRWRAGYGFKIQMKNRHNRFLKKQILLCSSLSYTAVPWYFVLMCDPGWLMDPQSAVHQNRWG